MRVLVAMSGGVDSSMAAALLCDEGHDVTGVHLKMADTPSGLPGKGCCTLDDSRDARRVADALGIGFYVWDFSEAFTERVVDDFVDEYAAGRTPNPCIRCNERVKYAALLARARAMGFDALATGHHVRVADGDGDGLRLLRGVDGAKDQSYVLYMASQEQLAHTRWPVGHHRKADLRRIAADRGLITARKPDSHDICFIPSGDVGGFLRPRIGSRPGPVVDAAGTVLAEHEGAWRFTVGQRRGLGLAGLSEPHFVTAVHGDTVVVGPRSALGIDALEAVDVHWIAGAPPPGDRVEAQIRYRASPVPARIIAGDDSTVRVEFGEERPEAVAPGQAVVFYDGEACLGGATITRTVPASRAASPCAATG